MRKGSIIANYIDQEYRMKKSYAKKKRANCMMQSCDKCQYEQICEDKNDT